MVNSLASVLATSMQRLAAVGAERTALQKLHLALKDTATEVLWGMEDGAFSIEIDGERSKRPWIFMDFQ